MKHSRIIIVASLILIATLVVAQTNQIPAQTARDYAADTISVTGVGRVTTTPDRVMFTAGVETVAPTVEDAVNQNSTRMAALIAALKRAGATDKDIRTSNFNVFPQMQYNERERPRVTGFQASNSVTVTRPTPAEAGKLLTAAVGAGANQVSGLTFTVADQTVSRNRGLQLAFEEARAKAALLASSAGRTVGRAVSIVEGSTPAYQPPIPYARAEAMQMKVADVPVEAGAEELSYTVSVVFELR